jgi:hypothetical protein
MIVWKRGWRSCIFCIALYYLGTTIKVKFTKFEQQTDLSYFLFFKIIESLRQEVSSSSSDDESSSENENETGEDIGILEEAWNDEDGSLGNSSEVDLTDRMKDPDWNANMEDEETDSSDGDELDEE